MKHTDQKVAHSASDTTTGRRQAGFSLIEVLVALLIFSFGLLGLVGLQTRALQFSVSAEDTSRAALLANEIATTMVTSQAISLDADVITAWQKRVADTAHGGLPKGAATVATAGNIATITVTWQAPSAGGAFNSQNQYVTQVVIP